MLSVERNGYGWCTSASGFTHGSVGCVTSYYRNQLVTDYRTHRVVALKHWRKISLAYRWETVQLGCTLRHVSLGKKKLLTREFDQPIAA